MADINNDLKIVTLRELLQEKLSIPGYQRPYRWSRESASLLITDTYEAYRSGTEEYRIGSVVLHREGETLNIVDGQQRLTTLSILIYAFSEVWALDEFCGLARLLEMSYGPLSLSSIRDNHEIICRKLREIPGIHRTAYASYLLDNCTMVKIVTDSEQEAFQFFDSQNSRGKELAPHDLLKSYHLREMADENETEKVQVINLWEDIPSRELELLFRQQLFPLVSWYKSKDGLNYSHKNIRVFKGIKSSNPANYAVYTRAASLYMEQYNSGAYELLTGQKADPFQLTQPLIAGRRFFLYSLHYRNLYQQIITLINKNFQPEEIPQAGIGCRYVRILFINILMFFADRFSLRDLTASRIQQLYCWAYSLRLKSKAVYKQSVNKYAQGQNTRLNSGLNLFSAISEMNTPSELDTIILDIVADEASASAPEGNFKKYPEIYKRVFRKEGI